MSVPNFRLDNKVVIVTGASKGLGRGLSKILAKAGAIIIACSRNLDDLDTLVEEIRNENGVAHAYHLDVSKLSSIKNTFKDIFERFQKFDVLINNAGLGNNHSTLDVSERDWDDMMNVNLKGLFFLLTECR